MRLVVKSFPVNSLVPSHPSRVTATHLVDLESLPLNTAQVGLVLEDELVRREKDVELELLGAAKLILSLKPREARSANRATSEHQRTNAPDDLSRIALAHVANNVHIRSPVLELRLPSRDR